MNVILDLWGVLLDEGKMNSEYNERASSMLASEFGGDPARWRDAYDKAWEDYKRRFESADWDRVSWSEVAGELDARLIADTLEAVGVKSRPPDILSFARNLESEVVSAVSMCYPDTPGVLRSLREKGHRIHVATQAGEWNAIGALDATGLLGEVSLIFSGSSQNTSKGRSIYWTRALEKLGNPSEECILVDDRLDFLEAAASVGVRAVLMDRDGRASGGSLPRFVSNRMPTLAGLPPYVECIACGQDAAPCS